jgi:tetratricopeptide (TPR) repeat protein
MSCRSDLVVRALLVWATVLGLHIGTRIAHADTSLKRARTLNELGMSKYRRGEYDDALMLFKQAYEIRAEPKILFNVAQTYRKQLNYGMALESYRRYLQTLPDAKNRVEVEGIIAELEGLVAAEAKPEVSAEPALVPAPVPSNTVPAPPLDTSPQSEPRRWYQDTIGWTLASSGLVLAAVGAGFYVHAQGQKDDLPTTPEGDRAALRDDIGRNQTLGGTGLILGGALVAGGIVKFVLTERASRGHRVTVTFGPSSIWVAGRF